MPHVRHSKRSENTSRCGRPRRSSPSTIANAAPPPSRYDVSIESVSRLRRSPSMLHAIDDHLERRAALQRGRDRPRRTPTAWPSISSRPKPRRRSVSSVSAMRIGAGLRAGSPIVGVAVVAVVRLVGGAVLGRHRHDRQLEADQQPRARRQLAEPPGHDLRRLADDLLPALPADTCGRRARTAAACSRGSRWSCRPSSAGCGRCSSAGWRWPGRCPRCDRRPASPSARGTAGRRPTATRRSGAALRRRSCRRRATTCPSR